MSQHRRHGLTLQGTIWGEERRLKEALQSTAGRPEQDDPYNRLRLLQHRQGKLCLARAVIAIRETEVEPDPHHEAGSIRTLWRLPKNPLWNPPSDEDEWELLVYRPENPRGSRDWRILIEGPVMDQNGCVYGTSVMSIPGASNVHREGMKKGTVRIGGERLPARNEWREFIRDDGMPIWVEIIAIKAPERNIFEL